MTFNPSIIKPAHQINQFTTVSQEYPVTDGIWRGDLPANASIANKLTEQGILPDMINDIDPSYYTTTPLRDTSVDKNPICRWVTPSYQTIGGTDNPSYLDVGVIAFHHSGIEKVVFYLNGITATNPNPSKIEVNEVTYNPEQDVSAYWIRINSSDFTIDSGDIINKSLGSSNQPNFGEGAASIEIKPHHELQAVVYPKQGKPRILVGKHNTTPDTPTKNAAMAYNGIISYIDQTTGIQHESQDSGIRSFYFSSNTNNTLFNAKVYVDATNVGLDSDSHDGSSSLPFKTIDFALRKLMTMKYRFYNPADSQSIVEGQGDVGGATIYLKDLGNGPELTNGHKWGQRVLNETLKIFARMRWITIEPAPDVTEKSRAKIKGCHIQSTLAKTKTNLSQAYPIQLLKFNNCLFEMDWPWSEYAVGIGPVLDYTIPGRAPDWKLQHNGKTWEVKKGVFSPSTVVQDDQEFPLFRFSNSTISSYRFNNTDLESTIRFQLGYVPPVQWYSNTVLDGVARTRDKIYAWAEANGMTYSTTMVPVHDFKTGLPAWFPPGFSGAFLGDKVTPVPEGLALDTVPAIFVKAQQNITGQFTTAAGYTFEFPWSNPEGSGTNADIGNNLALKSYVTNCVFKNVLEPAKNACDMWINSTLDQWEADVVRSGGLIYQLFAINGFRSQNYVNVGGANLFRVHSDMFQANTGHLSFKRNALGINNLIFYRFNNPSPRSPRYDDPVARHGLSGTGPLVDQGFEGQWSISGRISNNIEDRLFNFPVSQGGDGQTYEFMSFRNLKDIAIVDCFLKTPDGTQQLVVTCPHENLFIANTQIIHNSSSIGTTLDSGNTSIAPALETTNGVLDGLYRYKDAVPSNPTIHYPNNNSLTDDSATRYDLAVIDNLQAYTMSEIDHSLVDTYEKQLVVFVGVNNNSDPVLADRVKSVNIDFRGRPDGSRPEVIRDPRTVLSDLNYPFEKSGGTVGPNQKIAVGVGKPNIFFPVFKSDELHAIDTAKIGIIQTGQPNSNTKNAVNGLWYQNGLTGDIIGANYGWMPSAITYENFFTPEWFQGGETITISQTNKALFDADPGNTFLYKQKIGWQTDPSQRGFKNNIQYRFTNFDYDGTRGDFGEVLPRSLFSSQQIIQQESEAMTGGVQLQASQGFSPFPRSVLTSEFALFKDKFGVTEMVDLIQDRAIVAYQFDSLDQSGVPGYRGINFGPGIDPGFRWLSFITGYSGGFTANNNWEYRSSAAAAGVTPGSPNWNNDFGWDLWQKETSISEWYKWGIRKFHIHQPFGKVTRGVYGQTLGSNQATINALISAGNTVTPEASVYQIDSYQLCRDGFIHPETGHTGNIPMPWLTNDVVDGITQGFVPLFKALITGTAGDLSQDTWKRLTGIGGASAWYNPEDPIEIIAYNGGLNHETYERWKAYFESDPETARRRLRESYEPFARAGMRLAIDALVVSPGPVVGENDLMSDEYKFVFRGSDSPDWKLVNKLTGEETPIPQNGLVFPTPIWRTTDFANKKIYAPPLDYNGNPIGKARGETLGGQLDQEWWSFFSGHIVPTFGQHRIYSEAIPDTFIINGVGKPNPYIGFNTMGFSEFIRAGFGGRTSDTPSTPYPTDRTRFHYLRELGEVEVVHSISFGEVPWVGISGPNGFKPGYYWFLKRFGKTESTSGSGLPPLGAGEVYLRTTVTPGYGEQMYMGYVVADHLQKYYTHNNDPTKVNENKTKHMVMFAAPTKRKLPNDILEAERVKYGVTLDFNRRFPTITEYANYIGALKNTTQSPDPANPNYGIPSRIIDIEPIAKEFAAEVRGMETVDGIGGSLLLYVQSWDAFAGTKLFGISGGQFYVPQEDVDMEETKFRDWMDTVIASWIERYGTYPKHIIWNLTEYGFSGKTGPLYNREPIGFEMERYFFDPATLPFNASEEGRGEINSYSVRGLPYYGLDGPGITWDASQNSERFYSRGYDIARLERAGEDPVIPANPLYTRSKDIILDMIAKLKRWRTDRGIPAKVGVYHVPFMPRYPYNVYKVEGVKENSEAVVYAAGGWNDLVWPKQSTVHPYGVGGWYTPQETNELKKVVNLEFRKRWEPIVKESEVLFPELYNDSCRENIFEDGNVEGWIETHRKVVDLANEFKTIPAWSTEDPNRDSNTEAPAGVTVDIIPLTAYSVVRPNCGRLGEDDPVVKKNGSLYAHENQEYTLTDWLRDEYLRPKFRRPAKVQGLSMWRGFEYNATNALYTSSYTGREEDREWVLKYIQAEDGKGVTIDWNNPVDVDIKFRRYLQIINGLTRRYLHRFDRGIPRRDIHRPYYHAPFAAGWNPGISADGSMAKRYPESIGGMPIPDIVPFLWVGYGPSGQTFRNASNTGGVSNEILADVRERASLIPPGKRVIMPWYWQIESPAGQRPMIDYYENTTDGMVYGGTKYRAHETPGGVTFLSPWAYNNTRDAKSSITAFLQQCGQTGISFDAIGSDFENWGWLGLSSVYQSFDGPWGPTGEPAAQKTVTIDGIDRTVVVPWDEEYDFLQEPDNRIASTAVSDSRFAGLTNYTTGLSMGGAIEKVYNEIRPFMPTLVNGYGYSNPGNEDIGLTAGQIMAYFTVEGPTGISAATGPASVDAYYNPALQNWQEATRDRGREIGNPWRLPYTNSTYPLAAGKSVSIKLAWFAWQRALESLVHEDHTQRKWVDTLRGSTSKEIRNVEFAEYDAFPLSVDEGVFIRDPYSHPFLAIGEGSSEYINPSPEQYGSILNDSMKTAVYHTNPTTDEQKYIITLCDAGQNPPAGTVRFAPSFDITAARSWISLLMEVQVMRGILRTDPSAWLNYTPWVNTPWDNPDYNGFHYTIDPVNTTDIERRTYSIQYFRELVFHALLHGAKWFHLFNDIPGNGGLGLSARYQNFLQGATLMQGIFNEWNSLTNYNRVRPASNPTGNYNALVERVNLSDAGANHEGATGTLISGARVLSADSFGLTSSVPFGANPNETYIWRISVPPQGVGCTYDRVDIPGFGSATQDLPLTVYVPANETGFWIKRTGNPYKPQYRWRKPTTDGMGTVLKNRDSSAIGFPSTNPNSVFTGGDSDTTIGSGANSDIRVIAAWKSDPIPFDKSTETTVTICAYHPSGIQRVEASLNGGLTASILGNSPINDRYQEFTFSIPQNLPQTTGFPTGTLHEIRAKIFPIEGKPRILGGQPTDASVYYTAATSLMGVAPTKEQANETSYFLCNEDPHEVSVIPNSWIVNMGTSQYSDLRNAILFELGNRTGSDVLTEGSGGNNSNGNWTPFNRKFVKIKVKNQTNSNLNILGDPGTVSVGGFLFFADRNGAPTGLFDPTWNLLASSFDFSGKALVIERDSGSSTTPTMKASTIGNTNPPPRPAGFSTAVPGANQPFSNPNSVYAIPLGLFNPGSFDAYCTFENRIYRLNKSLADRSGPFEFGGAGFTPNELSAPSGTDTSNSTWIFESGTGDYESAVGTSRSVNCLGVGRIKFKNVIVDRGSVLEFSGNNRLQFDGVTFTSSLQPPTESRVISTTHMASFTGCNIDADNPTRHGFNGARRVYGCNAANIYTGAFIDNLMVQSSSATGAQQKDNKSANPILKSNFSLKNAIYSDITISGSSGEKLQEGVLIGTGGGIISGVQGACADHEGLALRNISLDYGAINASLDKKGILINGNAHQVFLDGLSFSTESVNIDNSYKVVADALRTGTPPISVFGAKPQRVSSIGGTRTAVVFDDPSILLRPIIFGPEGSTFSSRNFAVGVNYNTNFGITLSSIQESVPNISEARAYIRGIPQVTGTGVISNNNFSLYISGMESNNAKIGGVVGWTAPFTQSLSSNGTVLVNVSSGLNPGNVITVGVTLSTFYTQRYISAGLTIEPLSGATFHVMPSVFDSTGVWSVSNGNIPTSHWLKVGNNGVSWITNPTTTASIRLKIRSPFSTTLTGDIGNLVVGPIPTSNALFILDWNSPGKTGAIVVGGETYGLGIAAAAQENATTIAKIPILWTTGPSAGQPIWPGSTADFPDFSRGSWKIIYPQGSAVG